MILSLITKKKKNYLLPLLILIFFLILIAIGINYKRNIIRLFNPDNSKSIPAEVSESQNINQNNNDKKTDIFSALQLKADNLFKKGSLKMHWSFTKKFYRVSRCI